MNVGKRGISIVPVGGHFQGRNVACKKLGESLVLQIHVVFHYAGMDPVVIFPPV